MRNQLKLKELWDKFISLFTVRLKLFLFVFLIFSLTIHFTLQGPNPTSRFLLTKSIVERGEFWFPVEYKDQYWLSPDYAQIEDRLYSDKAPGLSFLAIPFFILGKIIGPLIEPVLQIYLTIIWQIIEPYVGYYPDKDVYAVISIQIGLSLLAALGILRLFDISRLMGISERNSILAALITAFATPYWVYARTMFSHVPAAVFLLSSLYHILKYRNEKKVIHLIIAGFFSGFGFVIEFPSVFAIPWFSVLLLLPLNQINFTWKNKVKSLFLYEFTTAIFILPLFFYNFISFGGIMANALSFSHWADNLHLLEPVHEGIFVLLLSNTRGLFYFSPILIFGFIGLLRAYRYYPLESSVFFSLILCFIIFYAKKWESHGGAAFGPRYIVPILLLIGLGLAWTFEFIKTPSLAQGFVIMTTMFSFLSTTLGALFSVLIFGQEDPIFVEALNKLILGDTNAPILRLFPQAFIFIVIILFSIFISGTILPSSTQKGIQINRNEYEYFEAFTLFSWSNFAFVFIYFVRLCFILSATYIKEWEDRTGEIFVRTIPPSDLWLILAFLILVFYSSWIFINKYSSQILNSLQTTLKQFELVKSKNDKL